MRKLFVILALVSAILAVILSVLPLSNLAFAPAIAALVFGLLAFRLSKKENQSKKIIQLAFLLTILALVLATYKAIFNTETVGDTIELEEREVESKEDAIEELENLDIDEIDIIEE